MFVDDIIGLELMIRFELSSLHVERGDVRLSFGSYCMYDTNSKCELSEKGLFQC